MAQQTAATVRTPSPKSKLRNFESSEYEARVCRVNRRDAMERKKERTELADWKNGGSEERLTLEAVQETFTLTTHGKPLWCPEKSVAKRVETDKERMLREKKERQKKRPARRVHKRI
jgi:hypothetical protein